MKRGIKIRTYKYQAKYHIGRSSGKALIKIFDGLDYRAIVQNVIELHWPKYNNRKIHLLPKPEGITNFVVDVDIYNENRKIFGSIIILGNVWVPRLDELDLD